MWLALLGMHLVGLVGFNLLLRKSHKNKVDGYALATILQVGIAIPAVFLLVIFPPDILAFSATVWLFLAVAIVFTIGLHISNVTALKYLEAGVYAIVYNLRIVFTTVLGIIFLNEEFILLRIIGGGLILLAIFIIKQRSSKSARLHGLLWGLAAAMTLSVLNITEKTLINNIGFINYFPLLAVVSAILMLGFYFHKNKKIEASVFLGPNMIKLMIFRALSAYGFSGALGAGALVSVGNYVSGMSVIFTVLLGAWLLGETDYLGRKIAAAGLAFAGLTLVLLASLV